MKNNKFKIVIPVYNSKQYIGTTLLSLINQTYKNWECIVIDDASTDGTGNAVKAFLINHPKMFTIITNTERQFALPNTITGIHTLCTDDEDIVIVLDGDDWFKDDTVLEHLNNVYQNNNIWATYGQYECLSGTPGVCCDSDMLFDRLNAQAKILSHLRTYKYWLFKKIREEDLKDSKGEYYHSAGDVAVFYCIAEMAGNHLEFIPKVLYVYNNTNSNNIFSTRPTEQIENGNTIQNQIAYKPLFDKNTDPFRKIDVKLYDKNFAHLKFAAINENVPRYITWNRNPNSKCPFTIYTDLELNKIDTTKDNDSINIAWLLESYAINPKPYHYIKDNYQKFDYVLTYDYEYLDALPNSIFMPGGRTWIERKDWQIYPKTVNTTYIYSILPHVPGHHIRTEIYNMYKDVIDVVVGKSVKPFDNKIDVLKDTRYCIVPQNSQRVNYFTERLIDCFLTGTVPIFWGDPHDGLKRCFNVRGMHFFHSARDLSRILAKLGENDYNEKMLEIQDNFLRARRYGVMEDYMYINILRRLETGGTF